MKKFAFLLLLTTASFFISAYGKTNSTFTRPWTVDSHGFLVFPTVDDLNTFIALAQTKTHAEMQQYITDSLSGFSSLGSSLYSNSDNLVTESEAINYALNTYRIIQTAGLIVKPINVRECQVNYEFLLVLTSSYLNNTSYGNLQSGTYDSTSMNKFATYPTTEGSPLVSFCASTPNGHSENVASCPSGELPSGRRFWGWTTWICGECDGTGHHMCHKNYYMFWIKVDITYDYQECQ